jgi:hypothetical protein
MIHPFSFSLLARGAWFRGMEVNCLVFHPGVAFLLFGLVDVVLGAVIVIGLFYLLVKLAGLVDAMTDAKRASV